MNKSTELLMNAVSEVIDENVFLSEIEKNEKADFDEFLTDDEDIASRINTTFGNSSGTSKTLIIADCFI